jgi:hypothetical protein
MSPHPSDAGTLVNSNLLPRPHPGSHSTWDCLNVPRAALPAVHAACDCCAADDAARRVTGRLRQASRRERRARSRAA